MSIEGNKPKKFWRKANHNNPTFSSSAITRALINPQFYHYEHQPKAMNNSKQRNYDSLEVAQKRFQALKLQNNLSNLSMQSNLSFRQNQNRDIENSKGDRSKSRDHKMTANQHTSSTPTIQKAEFTEQYKKLNYLNFKSIQEKQLHGYNILSNV